MNHFAFLIVSRRISALVVVILAAIFLGAFTASGEPQAVISPGEFEKKVKELRLKLEIQESSPDELSTLVLDRLKEYRATTDDSVMDAVHAIKGFEGSTQIQQNGGIHPGIIHYPQTKAYIESVIPWVMDNKSLHGRLLWEAGMLMETERDLENAAVALQKGADLINAVRLDGDLLRLHLYVDLGNVQLRSSHKELAKKAYSRVLSYSWYLIEGNDPRREAFEMYLSAGIGLIECSRFDLQSLKDIHFVPAALAELEPILNEAIRQAQEEEAMPRRRPRP